MNMVYMPAPTTNRQLCTGWGQFDTRKNDGLDYQGITHEQIVNLVRNPPSVDKEKAQWLLPSTYRASDGREFKTQGERGEFWCLGLDEDGTNSLSLDEIDEALASVLGPVHRLIYSSRSSTPEKRKWRALVPLAAPISGPDYEDTVAAFNAALIDASAGILIPDPAFERAGQLIYLPNRGEHYEHRVIAGEHLSLGADHPIIQRREAMRAERAKIEAEIQAKREEKRRKAELDPNGNASIVEAFNSAYPLEAELERHGYTRHRNGRDWRSPNSTTGSASVCVFGDRWYSFSGSDDALAIGCKHSSGGRYGDAFDLFVHYEHGGNFRAAVRDYAQQIKFSGVESTSLPEGCTPLSEGAPAPATAPASTAPTFRHVALQLIRDDKERPIWNVHNAVVLLSDHPDWQGVLAYDLFSVRRVLLKPIPGQRAGGEYPKPLEDDDYTATIAWFNNHGFPKAGAEISDKAVRKVCRQQAFDPLCDYLNGLVWDGTPRLAGWLTTYCGAEPSAYVSEAGLRWCISAVARGFAPGCKADHMLVLEGPQGARKSSALAALAGAGRFSDGLPPMGTKDAQSYLRGQWIIEVAELEAMRREMDQIKAYITRQVERFRPAHGREEVDEPRRCVFAGTTNKDDWLHDETGGRRFWPVRVGVIDVDAIERDRDQLWAEAVSLYRQGERWWMQGEIEAQARASVAERRADDPWRADIAKAVEGHTEVAAKQVLAALRIIPQDMTPKECKRVTQELQSLGWVKSGRVVSGEHRGAARYVRG